MLLLNTRSGANGLNLIEATHIFFLEPVINPGVEAQAVSRVHRIGQHRRTHVHHFIMADTVEDRIFRLWDHTHIHSGRRTARGSGGCAGGLRTAAASSNAAGASGAGGASRSTRGGGRTAGGANGGTRGSCSSGGHGGSSGSGSSLATRPRTIDLTLDLTARDGVGGNDGDEATLPGSGGAASADLLSEADLERVLRGFGRTGSAGRRLGGRTWHGDPGA